MAKGLPAAANAAQGVPSAPVGGGEAPSWFTNLLQKLKIDGWLQSIGISASDAMRILYFFVGAFVIGFALKKYFKFIIACSVIVVTLALLLESQGIITIDWVAFKKIMGIEVGGASINGLWDMVVVWVKANLYAFIGGVLGFIIGYKLG